MLRCTMPKLIQTETLAWIYCYTPCNVLLVVSCWLGDTRIHSIAGLHYERWARGSLCTMELDMNNQTVREL